MFTVLTSFSLYSLCLQMYITQTSSVSGITKAIQILTWSLNRLQQPVDETWANYTNVDKCNSTKTNVTFFKKITPFQKPMGEDAK